MDNNVNPFGQPDQQPNVAPDAQPTAQSVSQPADQAQPAAQPASQSPNDPMFPDTASANPVMPSAPQPMSAYGPIAPVAQGAKKSHKGLIIGAIAGVLAVVAIVVVVLIVAMGRVKPEEYRQAYSKLIKVSDATYDVSSEISYGSMDSEEDFAKATDKANAAIADGQKKIDELAKLKAIANDKDAKAKYETMNKAYGEFGKEAKAMFDKMNKIIPVYVAMLDIDYSSDYGAMASYYQGIADKARAVDVDDDELKGAMNDLASAAEAYANYYKKIAAGDYSVSYSSLSDASDKMSDASDVVLESFSSKNLEDSADKVTNAYNDLRDYLLDKSTTK